jgi:hypothetical protein
VSEFTPEETWAHYYPDDKIPGSAEPLEGKCGARVRDKRLKELDIVRYCVKTAGMGTDHFGEGTCKFHLGSTANHTKGAVRTKITKEIKSLAEQLGEPELIGPPEVEAWILASKMKQWTLILEEKMDELHGALEVTDKAGVEHTRALIEIMERAWERFQSALEFMLRYDLRKRVIELEEHQAQLVGAVFMAIILSTDMKLSEQQINMARLMFAEKMMEIGPKIEPTWAANIVDADPVED